MFPDDKVIDTTLGVDNAGEQEGKIAELRTSEEMRDLGVRFIQGVTHPRIKRRVDSFQVSLTSCPIK